MNLPLGALLSVALFILPGALSSMAESERLSVPGLSYGLNRHLLIALLMSVVMNLVWVVSIEICPWLPDIDWKTILDALAGGHAGDVAAAIERDQLRIAAYYGTLLAGCASIGWLAPNIKVPILTKRPLTFLPRPRGIQNYLVSGEKGIWCVVDVLTKRGRLYRGLFHSFEPEDSLVDGAVLHLCIASRWAARIPPPGFYLDDFDPDNDEDAAGIADAPEDDEGEWDHMALLAHETSLFHDIRSHVSPFELGEMIYASLDPELTAAEAEGRLGKIFANSKSILDFLTRQVSIPPDLSLPVQEVRNINMRHFRIE